MGGLIYTLLHIDDQLKQVIVDYGTGTYVLLAGVIFAETGLVVFPFLPGDSLLFATGIFCRPEQFPDGGGLNLGFTILLLWAAAFTGDNVNYFFGRFLGERLFRSDTSRVFRRSHLIKTQAFFERHGAKTIVLARFVPIVRTFAPFVAGMGAMTYRRFALFSLGGGLLWVTVCVGAGYLFGGIPVVRQHFSLAMIAIVAISVIPAAFEWGRHRQRTGSSTPEQEPA